MNAPGGIKEERSLNSAGALLFFINAKMCVLEDSYAIFSFIDDYALIF